MNAKIIEAIEVTDQNRRVEYFRKDGTLLDTNQMKHYRRVADLDDAVRKAINQLRPRDGSIIRDIDKITCELESALNKEYFT